MPLYKSELRLATDMPSTPARRWRNTFYVEAGTAIDAADLIRNGWQEQLRAAARDRVYAYEVYASSVVAGDDDFTVLSILPGNQRGNIETPEAQPYLPKVCLGVTLRANAGRPSRKFWRPGLTENDITNGVSLEGTLVTVTTNAFNLFVQEMAGALRDPDGQLITGVAKITLTTREFGREATVDVPLPPPFG